MKIPSYYLIQSFLAFCQNRNIVEAAQSLGLSQPAMTAHLKAFEAVFDHDVFLMRGRKKELSLFGRKLSAYFLAQLGTLEHDLQQIEFEFLQPTQARIKIGARSEIINYFSDKLNFPGYITFDDIDGKTAVESVVDKSLDLAISNHLEKAQDLICKKAFTDQFVILCPKKYFKGTPHLDQQLISQLLAKPFISYIGEDPYLEKILKHFSLKTENRPYRNVSNWLTIIKMIESGVGWSIVPQLYCNELSNLIAFDLQKIINTETHFYFLYRKELRKVRWFQDFIDHLKTTIENE